MLWRAVLCCTAARNAASKLFCWIKQSEMPVGKRERSRSRSPSGGRLPCWTTIRRHYEKANENTETIEGLVNDGNRIIRDRVCTKFVYQREGNTPAWREAAKAERAACLNEELERERRGDYEDCG